MARLVADCKAVIRNDLTFGVIGFVAVIGCASALSINNMSGLPQRSLGVVGRTNYSEEECRRTQCGDRFWLAEFGVKAGTLCSSQVSPRMCVTENRNNQIVSVTVTVIHRNSTDMANAICSWALSTLISSCPFLKSKLACLLSAKLFS